MSDADGAMGAGGAEGPDIAMPPGGDATGGGDPGDQDAMGSDEELTVDDGSGRTDTTPDRGADRPATGDFQQPGTVGPSGEAQPADDGEPRAE